MDEYVKRRVALQQLTTPPYVDQFVAWHGRLPDLVGKSHYYPGQGSSGYFQTQRLMQQAIPPATTTTPATVPSPPPPVNTTKRPSRSLPSLAVTPSPSTSTPIESATTLAAHVLSSALLDTTATTEPSTPESVTPSPSTTATTVTPTVTDPSASTVAATWFVEQLLRTLTAPFPDWDNEPSLDTELDDLVTHLHEHWPNQTRYRHPTLPLGALTQWLTGRAVQPLDPTTQQWVQQLIDALNQTDQPPSDALRAYLAPASEPALLGQWREWMKENYLMPATPEDRNKVLAWWQTVGVPAAAQALVDDQVVQDWQKATRGQIGETQSTPQLTQALLANRPQLPTLLQLSQELSLPHLSKFLEEVVPLTQVENVDTLTDTLLARPDLVTTLLDHPRTSPDLRQYMQPFGLANPQSLRELDLELTQQPELLTAFTSPQQALAPQSRSKPLSSDSSALRQWIQQKTNPTKQEDLVTALVVGGLRSLPQGPLPSLQSIGELQALLRPLTGSTPERLRRELSTVLQRQRARPRWPSAADLVPTPPLSQIWTHLPWPYRDRDEPFTASSQEATQITSTEGPELSPLQLRQLEQEPLLLSFLDAAALQSPQLLQETQRVVDRLHVLNGRDYSGQGWWDRWNPLWSDQELHAYYTAQRIQDQVERHRLTHWLYHRFPHVLDV